MRRLIMVAACLAVALSVSATEEWRFEVAADAPKVVSCPVDANWAKRMATQELVAVGKDGSETVVPWMLDNSGRRPELVWLADGRTRFALRERRGGQGLPAPKTDLAATDDEVIRVGNSFFSLQHPVKGKGGFPEKICFVKSGAADDGLCFMDQFVRQNTTGGVDVLAVRSDGNASARLVFSSPLRAVVEVRAKIAAVDLAYRYIYEAYSPVVRVDVTGCQAKGDTWGEAWTVALSWKRESPRYSAYLKKADEAPTPFQEKGKKSRAFSDHWLAFTDGTNAVGVASVWGAVGWDASSSFVYYLLAQRDGWDTMAMARSALLYLGPVQSRDGFDHAFAGVRPQVKVMRDNLQWVPTDPMSVRSDATLLEGRGIRLAFDSAERGFNCIGIENRVNPDPAALFREEPGRAAFWELTFWKDGSPTNALKIDNLAPC